MAEQKRARSDRGDTSDAESRAEETTARNERRDGGPRLDGPGGARVREEDLEPHAGLRYIAKLFKVLSIILVFMLIAEIVIGLSQDGTAAIGTLLVQATRLIVFAAFLWAAGDLALMLIESNHDLRAVRILLGRINSRLQQGSEFRAGTTTAERKQGGPPERIPPGVL